MTYILINQACDGRHVRIFDTEQKAHRALEAMLGRSVPQGHAIGQTYVSDWGNRLTVEERPAGHTAARERRLAAAYDARECGVATKAQLALLERGGL